MSTSIENLRRLAERDVKDHTALFDLYVTVGRDIDYLSIKFGIDPDDLINLLEGYGEKLRVTADDVAKNPKLAAAILEANLSGITSCISSSNHCAPLYIVVIVGNSFSPFT